MTLYHIGQEMLCGLHTHYGFNDSLTVFPPKGEDPRDPIEITRAPEDTRPLALKNTNNKIQDAHKDLTEEHLLATPSRPKRPQPPQASNLGAVWLALHGCKYSSSAKND